MRSDICGLLLIRIPFDHVNIHKIMLWNINDNETNQNKPLLAHHFELFATTMQFDKYPALCFE